jgi:protein TonB
VKSGGFREAVAVEPSAKAAASRGGAPETAVTILDKPRPAYTEEARRAKVEGEVWLEVEFGASGVIRVLRVVRSLGHGLDENAIKAAQAIRFRPALRGGAPVDSVAIARISFQLAY